VTTQQTIVVAALWLAVAGLFALVLLLYRSVERAYAQADRHRQAGLLPGAEAPPVEILTGAGLDFLEPPSVDSPYLLGFVSGECDECKQLLDSLLDDDVLEIPATLVIVDRKDFDREVPDGAGVVVHPAAHPPDLDRGYGLTILPLVYVMRGWTVLAVATAFTAPQLEELFEQARATAAKLDADAALASEDGPVHVVTGADPP
jgi:hypothetical protein